MKLLKTIVAISLTLFLSACGKEDSGPTYTKIASPQSSADVTMFFWYRCPACYKAEKELSELAKNKDIDIEYRHSAIWEDDAKLFYTLDLLGLTDEYQSDLMDYFRKASNPSLSGVVKVIDEKYSEEQILRRLESPHVKNRIMSTRSYESYVGSNGVPLIIVDNKYALIGKGLSPGGISSTIENLLENRKEGGQ